MSLSRTPAAGGSVERTGPRGGRTLLVVALFGAIYLCYAPALDGEFQFDDTHSIVTNPAIKDFGHPGRLTPRLLLGASRALTDLTFAINYRLGGLEVRPYHLVNLALHFATVLVLLLLSLRILRRLQWPAPFATALLAAALFGLHPLQSQAVAYICQRAEVLAAFLYALGLLLALEHAWLEGGSPGSLAAAFACFLLGWESKETLASFPAALVLCLLAFPNPRGGNARAWVRRLAVSLPFWALTAAFALRTVAATSGSNTAGFAVPQLGVGRYFLTQARVLLTYLRLLFWPAGQTLDWDFPPSTSLAEPRTALSLLAVGAILAAAAWLWRWSLRAGAQEPRALGRLAAFGVFWFFVLLSPTSSVIPVVDVIEEHRVYLASFGIILPAAAAGILGARHFFDRKRALPLAAAFALLAALGVALHRRAQVWESAIALWTDAATKSPMKPRVHMDLGSSLMAVDPARAEEEYRRALQLATPGSFGYGDLQIGALLSLGRFEEALPLLRDWAARVPGEPKVGNDLAIACLETGRLDEGQAAAARVAARFPRWPPARHTLGRIAFARGDFAEAKRDFAQALALDPDALASLSSLAFTEEKAGDTAAACRSWTRYARAAPGAGAEAARTRLASLRCPADQ